MTVRVDPENNETRALFDLVDLTGRRVLEIGSGYGRLTWRYAARAGHVTAIEPYSEWVSRAKAELPDELRDRVDFQAVIFEAFAASSEPALYDAVILSRSL
jgi:protein-L-isoaspartate O-methyltransferase